MRMISRIAFSAIVAVSFASAGKLAPNKTHAVLNVTYTNEENVPHAKKKLTFVGQNKGKKVVIRRTCMAKLASISRVKIPTRFSAKA